MDVLASRKVPFRYCAAVFYFSANSRGATLRGPAEYKSAATRTDLAFARRLFLDLLWFAEAFLLRRDGATLLAAKVARLCRTDRFSF